jgi:hypothetical protein
MEATVDVLKVAIPKMLPEVAVMVVDPIFRVAVATPFELMVAIVVFDEVQVTDDVMFCLLLLEKTPVAVN